MIHTIKKIKTDLDKIKNEKKQFQKKHKQQQEKTNKTYRSNQLFKDPGSKIENLKKVDQQNNKIDLAEKEPVENNIDLETFG